MSPGGNGWCCSLSLNSHPVDVAPRAQQGLVPVERAQPAQETPEVVWDSLGIPSAGMWEFLWPSLPGCAQLNTHSSAKAPEALEQNSL